MEATCKAKAIEGIDVKKKNTEASCNVEDGWNVKANMEATCTLKGVEGILRSTGRLYVN